MLPNEILYKIASYLPIEDVHNIRILTDFGYYQHRVSMYLEYIFSWRYSTCDYCRI